MHQDNRPQVTELLHFYVETYSVQTSEYLVQPCLLRTIYNVVMCLMENNPVEKGKSATGEPLQTIKICKLQASLFNHSFHTKMQC